MKIKILSYNIHKGFNWNNKSYALKEIKSLIQETGADIVFLQEVVGKNDEYKTNGLIDQQFEYLADEIWPHFSYAQNALYDHGHHGNMIMSKYPIESFKNFNISTNKLEKRGMLVCQIRIPYKNEDKIITACCLHLNLLHISRKKQYDQITKIINDNHNSPADYHIIAGDFNDWNKKSFKSFEDVLKMKEAYNESNGKLAKTFPSNLPLLCLDRIYVKNLNIISAKVIAGKPGLSDHLPLMCEVEIL